MRNRSRSSTTTPKLNELVWHFKCMCTNFRWKGQFWTKFAEQQVYDSPINLTEFKMSSMKHW